MLPKQGFNADIGTRAAKGVSEKLTLICYHEKRRIEKRNGPPINRIRARLARLQTELRKSCAVLLRPRTSRAQCQSRRFNFGFAFLFGLASLALGHLSLASFGLGWESWLLSAAFAGVGGFWTHKILERRHATKAMQIVFV